MGEFRGVFAAVVLFALPFVGGIALGRLEGRWRWLARVVFVVSIAAALTIGHFLTVRNSAGYRVLVVLVEVPFAVGALVAGAAGLIAGIALGRRLRRRRAMLIP